MQRNRNCRNIVRDTLHCVTAFINTKEHNFGNDSTGKQCFLRFEEPPSNFERPPVEFIT